jgi:hypothetical protein
MTLDEKIGQMIQVHAMGADAPDQVGDAIRAGRVGSIINQVDAGTANALQKIAVEESRSCCAGEPRSPRQKPPPPASTGRSRR